MMKWIRRVAHKRGRKRPRVLVAKFNGRDYLGDRRRQKDNIKMDI
jgi:hypothetical protein